MEKNPSIQCTVTECRHHSESVDYCTLKDILVGKQGTHVTDAVNTDCESFKVRESTY